MDTTQDELGPEKEIMQIYGPSSVHGPQHITAPHTQRLNSPQQVGSLSAPNDELAISDAGRLIDAVRDLPAIRGDRVAQIRAQLADGTYNADAKLDVALDRLLDEIA